MNKLISWLELSESIMGEINCCAEKGSAEKGFPKDERPTLIPIWDFKSLSTRFYKEAKLLICLKRKFIGLEAIKSLKEILIVLSGK